MSLLDRDITAMIDDFGLEVACAGGTAKGLFDTNDEPVLPGEGAPQNGRRRALWMLTGALPSLAVGTPLTVSGAAYTPRELIEHADGKVTEVLLRQPTAADVSVSLQTAGGGSIFTFAGLPWESEPIDTAFAIGKSVALLFVISVDLSNDMAGSFYYQHSDQPTSGFTYMNGTKPGSIAWAFTPGPLLGAATPVVQRSLLKRYVRIVGEVASGTLGSVFIEFVVSGEVA